MLKIKVIENEMPDFEIQVNEFVSRENIEITNMQYSTSGLAPDTECGWHTTHMHSVMISYKEN